MLRQFLIGSAVCILARLDGVVGLTQESSSRRGFLKRAPAAAFLSGTFFLLNINENDSLSGPQAAGAYERRDVGDDSRSGLTAAMNDQAEKTNNRLEASGFALDTREEEQARLSDALSSFSYESSTSSSKKTGKGSSKGKPSTDSKSK
jgi:hypothetical protein